MTLSIIIILMAIFGSLADAVPTIAFPLNSQVPPVARVAEPFNYTFSNSTFTSPFPISYSLSYGPNWLSLDSNTRTLSGIPSLSDVGDDIVTGVAVGLTATDSTGSTTLNATLVVTKNIGPIVNIPASSQLQQFGVVSAPSTLSYHPSTLFSFDFNPNTFLKDGSNSNLIYYAMTASNTPLPSWISFDTATLKFSGQTPDYQSLIQPPQTFGINLISSDVPGFSAATISFYIEVGVHILGFNNENMIVNITRGNKISYNGLAASLQLDGQFIRSSDLAIATAQAPTWINFDNNTLALTGIVPRDANPSNITIRATDIYGDTATAVVSMNFPTTIGTSSFPTSKSSSSISGPASNTSRLPFPSKTKSPGVPSAGSRRLGTKIWLAIFIPIIVLLLGLLLVVFCCYHRRQRITEPEVAPLKGRISPPIANTSSIEIVITPPRVSPPKPLELDLGLGLSFNHYHRASQDDEVEQQGHIPVSNDVQLRGLRESTTLDIGLEAMRESQAQESENWKNFDRQTRSLSENDLSTIESSWRSTKDSTYTVENSLTKPSHRSLERPRSPRSHRLSRNYSKCSRKGDSRRSARAVSSKSINGLWPISQGGSSLVLATENSTVGLGELNCSVRPVSAIPSPKKHTTPQKPTLIVPQHESSYARETATPPTRRQSRLSTTLEATRGFGHGVQESISSISDETRNRNCIGHGREKSSVRQTQRESKPWPVLLANENVNQARASVFSATSIYEDDMPSMTLGKATIRQVTHSPPVHISESSRNTRLSRPISRRISSSPFFSSRHSRKSIRSSKIVRISYADSPTVPEEEPVFSGNLENTIHYGFCEGNSANLRESYVMSFGLAKEGTRQLRSYIKNQLARNRARQSTYSNDSRDSRFESATTSMLSLSPPPVETQARDEFQDYRQETLSDGSGSWETAPRTVIDSEGNVFYDQRGREETPQVVVATVGAVVRTKENATGSKEELGIGPNVKLVRGAGRRPISSDVKEEMKSRRAEMEGTEADFTAYI